ncbi:MAG: NAAT family transporter [Candidatus Aenigmarchaeota archaeon]|nr:NAAT family transporter [Candidatus Aenigmarchaeota archaeon]
MVDFTFLWAAFLGIFAIVNPFSTAVVFLSITAGDREKKKRAMAKKASLVCACVLIFFMFSGTVLFDFFGLSLQAFQLAGGLLVAKLGFSMIESKSQLKEKERQESLRKEDVSIIPLAIPMLSGPGAITTAMVWMSQAAGPYEKFGLVLIAILISVISYIVLLNAKYLKNALGHTGVNVLEKLMGLIVLVMGIQFLINGLVDLNVLDLAE